MQTVQFKFKNGQKVKDILTGLTGVIDMQTILYTGNIQYSIQPQVKEGETSRPDSWYVDEESLELVENAIPGAGAEMVAFEFETGEKVKDKITGHKGIIIRSVFDLNRCIRYVVQGKVAKNNKVPDAVYINEKAIEPIGEKILSETSDQGGPSVRSNSARY